MISISDLLDLGFRPAPPRSIMDEKAYNLYKEFGEFPPLSKVDRFELDFEGWSEKLNSLFGGDGQWYGFSFVARKSRKRWRVCYADFENDESDEIDGDYLPFDKADLKKFIKKYCRRFWRKFKSERKPLSAIYVLESRHGCKIGVSKHPDVRKHAIGVKMPFKVQAVRNYVAPAAIVYDLEKLLHRAYSDKRLNGEWFDLSTLDVHAIDYVFSLGSFRMLLSNRASCAKKGYDWFGSKLSRFWYHDIEKLLLEAEYLLDYGLAYISKEDGIIRALNEDGEWVVRHDLTEASYNSNL